MRAADGRFPARAGAHANAGRVRRGGRRRRAASTTVIRDGGSCVPCGPVGGTSPETRPRRVANRRRRAAPVPAPSARAAATAGRRRRPRASVRIAEAIHGRRPPRLADATGTNADNRAPLAKSCPRRHPPISGTSKSIEARPSETARLAGRSVDNREAAIRSGEDGHQAPNRHAVGTPLFGRRLAVRVKDLPRRGAAALPTHAFRPGQQDLTAPIGGDDGVFALCASPGAAIGSDLFPVVGSIRV